MRVPKYIDPTTDYGFKRIFGSEVNKDLLIAFLNDLFRGRKVIQDLVYNKNEHVGETDDTGTVIFDLTCTADNGEKIIIEVQRSSQVNLKRRMLYYGSKLIVDQAPKGNRRKWHYAISEVYVIVLMDGFSLADSDGDAFLHDICLCNRVTGKIFYEDLGFIYIELVNFVKEEKDLNSDLDKWLYVLKNMSSMDKLPVYLRKSIFEKVFRIAEYSKLSKEEKEMYDTSLKNKWDEYSIQESARIEKERALQDGREEGLKQGLKQGLEKGLEKGLEEGRKDGIEQGLKEGLKQGIEKGIEKERTKAEAEKRAMALEFKKMGVPVKDIAKGTGLSVEEIEKLF